jgi:signal transduction histidine kinase
MEDLSLHLLDVAQNGIMAGASRMEIRINEDPEKDALMIELSDNGCGMSKEEAINALDPFYTSRDKRTGLGLPLLAEAAREAGGDIELQTEPGKGTLVRATFQLSHPDLRPLGDMLETLATLVCAHPDVQYIYEHRIKGEVACEWSNCNHT